MTIHLSLQDIFLIVPNPSLVAEYYKPVRTSINLKSSMKYIEFTLQNHKYYCMISQNFRCALATSSVRIDFDFSLNIVYLLLKAFEFPIFF